MNTHMNSPSQIALAKAKRNSARRLAAREAKARAHHDMVRADRGVEAEGGDECEDEHKGSSQASASEERVTETGVNAGSSGDDDALFRRAMALLDDERLLAAEAALSRVSAAYVHQRCRNKPAEGVKVERLRRRATHCTRALQEFRSEASGGGRADWRFGQKFLGITTWYRKGGQPGAADDGPPGSIWIKLQGELRDVDLWNVVAVIREIPLFHTWVPFNHETRELAMLGRCEFVVYFDGRVPKIIRRDMVMHVFGAELLQEHGCFLVLGRSTTAAHHPGVDVPPPPPTPRKHPFADDRMEVTAFKAMTEPTGPTSCSTSIIVNVDPKAPLPQWFVNFIIKKMAGVLLYKLQQRARYVESHPGCEHAQRIRNDPVGFYAWARPKFEEHMQRLREGWRAPPPTETDSMVTGSRPHAVALSTPAEGAAAPLPPQRAGVRQRTVGHGSADAEHDPGASAQRAATPARACDHTSQTDIVPGVLLIDRVLLVVVLLVSVWLLI